MSLLLTHPSPSIFYIHFFIFLILQLHSLWLFLVKRQRNVHSKLFSKRKTFFTLWSASQMYVLIAGACMRLGSYWNKYFWGNVCAKTPLKMKKSKWPLNGEWKNFDAFANSKNVFKILSTHSKALWTNQSVVVCSCDVYKIVASYVLAD